jgi:RNA polymerase sigma-70 factor (ECF subfamily)
MVESRSNEEWLAGLKQDGAPQQAIYFQELGRYLFCAVISYMERRGQNPVGFASLAGPEREELARDLVQQSLHKVYLKLNEYRGEGPFLAWAATIALRTAADELRRAHWRTIRTDTIADLTSQIPPTDSQPLMGKVRAPDVQLQLSEMWDLVNRAVEEDLSEQQRRAFLARFVDGRTNGEIGALEGVEPSVIYQRIHQARVKIKRRLRDAGYELF